MQSYEKTYEMLWDCKYCAQKKNLGLTHRHCPSCGAPQDANSRYFPAEHEKVAVQDHPFVGADVHCPACKTATSRAAKCCGNCGSPLTGGQDVRLVQTPAPQMQMPMAAPPKKKLNPLFIIGPIVALILAGLGIGAFFLFRKHSSSFVVASTKWERTIDIESYDKKRDSAWCDSVPSDGRVVGQHKEQRSSKQVPDGETCSTSKKDMGNGTFKEVRECKPKYRSEPVYDQKCDYEAMRWGHSRTATAQGTAAPASWPAPNITRPGTCVGCEREGSRNETYSVLFNEPSTNKTASCSMPFDRWNSFKVGAKYNGKIGMTGIDCDSLIAK